MEATLRARTRPVETPGPCPVGGEGRGGPGIGGRGGGSWGGKTWGQHYHNTGGACPEARGQGRGSGEQFRSPSLSCPELLLSLVFFFCFCFFSFSLSPSLCPSFSLRVLLSSPLLSSSLFLFFASVFVALAPTMLRNTDEFALISGMRGGRG